MVQERKRRAKKDSSRGSSAEAKPRIEDVAALAQTSAITVSRTLREPSLVAEVTRRRVLDAVEKLGYVPNFSASNLASQRSNIVILLVPTASSAIFPDTFRGVADSLAGTGLQLLLGDYGSAQSGEGQLLRTVIGLSPEAIVVVGVVAEPQMRTMLRRLGIPVVETWELADDPIDLAVGYSNEQAGAAIARHLLDRGRRHIAYAGPRISRSQARLDGMTSVLRENGLGPVAAIETKSNTLREGAAALGAILTQAPQTDAVFLSTDVLAVGLVLEARRRGIDIPGRLAVAGLGGLELAEQMQPSVTTIDVPAYEIGVRAGELLRQRLAGERLPARTVDVGFTLIVRETT